MQQTDFQRFKTVMAGLGRVYGADVDSVLLDAYWFALKSWEIQDFEKAAEHLVGNSQFMPRPADFTALRKASLPTAGEAFHRAMLLARRAPPREIPSLTSGNEAIDAAVRACGGYEQLAMCHSDKLGFLERRFAEHFDTISAADYTRSELPQLGFEPRKRLTSGPQPMGNVIRNMGGA